MKIIGPTVYRIADCTNPRKKVVHFNRLKRATIGKVPELAKGEDMVEGVRNDILPVGPVPGNRNGNDLVKDSLEEETVGMPSTEVTDQAPIGFNSSSAWAPRRDSSCSSGPSSRATCPCSCSAVYQTNKATSEIMGIQSPFQMTLRYCDVWGHTFFKRRNNVTYGARRLNMYMPVLYKCVV